MFCELILNFTAGNAATIIGCLEGISFADEVMFLFFGVVRSGSRADRGRMKKVLEKRSFTGRE
jgi:hypothetical protein